jgi:hypothetical protein
MRQTTNAKLNQAQQHLSMLSAEALAQQVTCLVEKSSMPALEHISIYPSTSKGFW